MIAGLGIEFPAWGAVIASENILTNTSSGALSVPGIGNRPGQRLANR